MERISGFQGLRRIGTFQLTHNPWLMSIDGLSGLQEAQISNNLYILNNMELCYILGELSNREYWMVRGEILQLERKYQHAYIHYVST